MKRYFTVTAVIALLMLLAAACDQVQGLKSAEAGTPGDFSVDLRRISLNASELATIPGINPILRITKTPDFATRNGVRWDSSDETVATVDPLTGQIEVVPLPGTVTKPLTTRITVKSVDNPSVYATCSLTVYPDDYPMPREWHFNSQANALGTPSSTSSSSNVYSGGDRDMGNGGAILQGTGSASGYNDGRDGPGKYVIDPENPYEFGLEPNGASRGSMIWTDGKGSGSFYPTLAPRISPPATAP